MPSSLFLFHSHVNMNNINKNSNIHNKNSNIHNIHNNSIRNRLNIFRSDRSTAGDPPHLTIATAGGQSDSGSSSSPVNDFGYSSSSSDRSKQAKSIRSEDDHKLVSDLKLSLQIDTVFYDYNAMNLEIDDERMREFGYMHHLLVPSAVHAIRYASVGSAGTLPVPAVTLPWVTGRVTGTDPNATELVKELFDNNLLQDEVGETSNKIPRGPRKDRGREEGHNKLVADYFAEHSVYNDVDFDRRFRMSRRLFLRIVNDLDKEVDFFKQQWDARGVKGFSPLQKCASAIRQLAYGSASDAFDEYLRMSETMSRDCLDQFCKGIIYLYMRQYLRKPTATDVQAIYALHEQTHGLPDMLGSIDCMHWYWKNCPMTWRGQFHRGDHPGPSVILEASPRKINGFDTHSSGYRVPRTT
ncbi:hypothetical protein OSB04_030399 [Centaurea solstitialis]|uniref:Uncharacterized protein n=1 Tax=Centaurea solstitialis TaxID=347529 RepID=A0AA38W743_9ASTR|nr:hypothetical protein OSB04_030399 [Centaurea solstitialis]